MDANSQDVSELIGSVDISKLDKYSEDDPRAMALNGAFNVGNRGIVGSEHLLLLGGITSETDALGIVGDSRLGDVAPIVRPSGG